MFILLDYELIIIKHSYSVSGSKPIEVAMQKTATVATTLVWIPLPYVKIDVDVKVDWGTFGKNPRFWSSTTYRDYSIRFGAQCGGSYCKVLFTVTNSQDWGQISSTNSQATNFYRSNNRTQVRAEIRNMNRATLVGYTVIQRKYRNVPDSYDWRTVLDNMSSCFDDTALKQYGDLPSLSVPATFIKGSIDYYDSDIVPGFIQFRKYGRSGNPYPICPGIKLETNADPSLHCIGGIESGSSYSSQRRCGDFSDWDQLAAHKIKRANSTTGDDVTDLTSTILLFYR
uniref:Intelectin-1-like n=1 Tax=Phallusia mammillata TaxID=59560 RepID=A0A6F9DFM6_9ASCI|nr:intelectin-1-like [Phallusia mammillata]